MESNVVKWAPLDLDYWEAARVGNMLDWLVGGTWDCCFGRRLR